MLRKLVLLFILICSTGIAYGQYDYLFIEKDIFGESCINIELKNSWERRRAFTMDKTPYHWNYDDLEYWRKKVDNIRKTYIPATIMQKIIESQTDIHIVYIADSNGNMVDILLITESRILNILSKEQLIELYQQMWTIKVRATGELTKDQYFRGQFWFLPRSKQDSDDSEWLKLLIRLKRGKSSSTK